MSFSLEQAYRAYYRIHVGNVIQFICKQCEEIIVGIRCDILEKSSGPSSHNEVNDVAYRYYFNTMTMLYTHWRDHGYVPPKIDVR